MAFRHGKYAEITINSHDLSDYADSADFSVDIDTAETSTFGGTWKQSLAGMAGGKLDLAGLYDPTATTGPAAVLSSLIGADPFPVVVYPGGNSTGQVSRTFDAILTSYAESSPVGGAVTWKASLVANGEVTFGTVS